METDRRAALTTLTYMVRALLATPRAMGERLVGQNAQPWAELLERLTRSIQPDLAPVVVPLLSQISRHTSGMTDNQRNLVGQSARRTLAFAWSQEPRIDVMIITALGAVCHTYESDPLASRSLLRQALEPGHIAAYGYLEMPHVVPEIGRLTSIAPELIEDFYRALLAHEETSDEPVPIGHSAIIPLISNRRQDFKLAVHQLGELFARFAEAAPVHATGAVIAAVEFEVKLKIPVPLNETDGEPIHVAAANARLADDWSYMWDCEGRSRHDAVHRMLDEFELMLIRLAEDPARADALDEVLNRVVRENRLAAVWRRILRAATATPATLGTAVRSLAWSRPVLTCDSTREPAGNFLRTIFSLLSEEEKGRTERTILGNPDGTIDERKPIAERQRDRLLGCLPSDLLVTNEAKEKIAVFETAGGAPPNDPPFCSWEFTYGEFTPRDSFKEQGVSVDQQPNRRLIELDEEAERFVSQFLNENPDQNQVRQILPVLRSLHLELAPAGSDVHPQVAESAATHLAGACATITRVDQLLDDPELVDFLRSVLLDASAHESPITQQEQAQSNDDSPGVSPSPRWHAADGLCRLARHPALADESVLDAIVRLSQDPVAGVRAQIARGLPFLHRTARKTAHAIFRQVCDGESNRWVIRAALDGASVLARSDPEVIAPLVIDVFHRVGKDTRPANIRQACLGLSLAINPKRQDPYDGVIVATALADLAGNEDLASQLIFIASGHLVDGPIAPPHPADDNIRLRSIEILVMIARRLANEFSVLETQWQRDGVCSEGERARAQKLRMIANQLGIRIQSASELFGGDATAHDGHAQVMDETKGSRFLRECSPLIDALLELPFPDVVHAVVETLQKFVPLAPGPVLLKIATAARQRQRGSYQSEQLGVGLFVKILRRYFADYRRLLQEERSYRKAIVEILNIFVRAGWPEALELTFRLEDIFR